MKMILIVFENFRFKGLANKGKKPLGSYEKIEPRGYIFWTFTVFSLLTFSLSCAQNSNRTNRKQFDPEVCNSQIEQRTADINDLGLIDSDNASEYSISGTCERDGSEVKIYIEGYPLDQPPTCNRGQWKISVDITGIVNKKERIQVAVSQTGNSGLLCKNTTNHFICPQGYIGVPEFSNFTGSAFCVMKYEAKVPSGTSLGSPYNRPTLKAEAIARGVLIKGISEENAINYCKENGIGYKLITNDEWNTIARHIESVDVNWSKKTTRIQTGNQLNIGSISGIKTSSNDDDINDERWSLNKRTHKLPNNEYIWDFSGNLGELVQHNISSLPTTYTGYIYNLPTSLKNLFGPREDYTILDDRERINRFAGLGYMQGSRFSGAILRGGSNNRTAGIFSVDTTFEKDRTLRPNIGFRCTYNP
ncbi:MAG: formylglycine-generating enzyme family protein [Oligoflexia bacterium]|nr:formylglycine-generating enzyme family protein [Oligoflexia bacterium]